MAFPPWAPKSEAYRDNLHRIVARASFPPCDPCIAVLRYKEACQVAAKSTISEARRGSAKRLQERTYLTLANFRAFIIGAICPPALPQGLPVVSLGGGRWHPPIWGDANITYLRSSQGGLLPGHQIGWS